MHLSECLFSHSISVQLIIIVATYLFSKDVSRVLCWQNFDFQFSSRVKSCQEMLIIAAFWNYCEADFINLSPQEHSGDVLFEQTGENFKSIGAKLSSHQYRNITQRWFLLCLVFMVFKISRCHFLSHYSKNIPWFQVVALQRCIPVPIL